jgi:hypothetical protein
VDAAHPRAALRDGKFLVAGAQNAAGADFATFLAY